MLAPSLASLALFSSVVSASAHRAGRHNAVHKRLASPAAGHAGLAARDGSRMTYYDTSVGLGSCGILHQNSEYTVALNQADMDAYGTDYPSPACGKTISISYGGTTVQATIQDTCPTCPSGGLDLSEGLFSALADQSVGVIYASWWYGSSSDDSATTSTTEEAAPTTTSSTEAAWTPATTSTEAAWTSSSSSSSEAAWTQTSEPAAATTTTADNWNIAAAVVQESSSEPAAAATTTTSSDTWAAATTSSTSDAWVEPEATSSSAEAWYAPTTTAAAWSAAASASATAEPVLDGETLCPTPPQFVVLANSTVLYNGTVPQFLNESLAASANATLFNASSPYDVADYICYNATLFSIELYEWFSTNASSTAANATVSSTFGLYATNATVESANATAAAANTTFLLGTNITLSAFEGFAATANVSTAVVSGAAADNSTTAHGLAEILDMLAASRSAATAEFLEESIVDEIEDDDDAAYDDEDNLEWCDEE